MPLHAQVTTAIRDELMTCGCDDGHLLPNEMDLARHFRVSRGTVRDAIKPLVDEGLIERRAGVGTRVTRGRMPTRALAWPSFRKEMADRGLVVHDLASRWQRVAASERVAEALGIRPGVLVWRLSRVRGVSRQASPSSRCRPIVWFRSWFAPTLGDVSGLALDDGLYRGLHSTCGAWPARSQETLAARRASAVIASRLKVEPGSPVLMRRRIVRDVDGRVIEFALNHYRGDRFEYAVDLQVDSLP